jgi:hypothetical protein
MDQDTRILGRFPPSTRFVLQTECELSPPGGRHCQTARRRTMNCYPTQIPTGCSSESSPLTVITPV